MGLHSASAIYSWYLRNWYNIPFVSRCKSNVSGHIRFVSGRICFVSGHIRHGTGCIGDVVTCNGNVMEDI